ncbi:MAG: adenylate/guanylate cyclase domain-containing protein [Rhodospirillaceae bacterium]
MSIGHKIYGIALAVLTLMALVAAYSVVLTANISRDLNLVATKQLPLSETIGRINVRVLEQGILIQRLFADHHDLTPTLERIAHLDEQIEADFSRAFGYLDAEAALEHPPETINALRSSTQRVEEEYRSYEAQGLALLDLIEDGSVSAFEARLPDFNRLQETVDEEIQVLHRTMELAAGAAVQRADQNQQFLLYFNAGMTTLAALLGLGVAAIVTLMIVRNVRNLASAAERVEKGALDITVPVVTKDEVGRLGTSFNAMVDGLRMKERIKDMFGKYMDPRIVKRLIDDPDFTRLGGDRREMTIMFIDLQGYTTISERLAPDTLVQLLNIFLSEMSDAVASHKGVVNDFQGDAVMAYWGPPFTEAHEHALLACRAALEANENFERFKQSVAREVGAEVSDLSINMRIGLSSGTVIAGNIGSTSSRKFSVIGDAVNLSARLEGTNKVYGTRAILSEQTLALAGDALEVRELDLIRVKGKTEPTRIYELRREIPNPSLGSSPAPQQLVDMQVALQAYRAQDWQGAQQGFAQIAAQTPTDPVPKVFLERIAYFQDHPPGTDWDGVWVMQTK